MKYNLDILKAAHTVKFHTPSRKAMSETIKLHGFHLLLGSCIFMLNEMALNAAFSTIHVHCIVANQMIKVINQLISLINSVRINLHATPIPNWSSLIRVKYNSMLKQRENIHF